MSRDAPIPDDTILASSGIEFQRYVPEIIKGCNGLSGEKTKQDVYIQVFSRILCTVIKPVAVDTLKDLRGERHFEVCRLSGGGSIKTLGTETREIFSHTFFDEVLERLHLDFYCSRCLSSSCKEL